MNINRRNDERGCVGIDYVEVKSIDGLSRQIFLYPSFMYFYVFCYAEEWLEGIHEF